MAGNWRVWWRCGHSFCLLLCFPCFRRPMTTSLWLQMKMTFSLLTAVHHYPLTGVKGFQLCPGSHRRKMRSDDKILGRSTSEAVSLVTHFTGTNDANQIPRLAPGQMDLCCSQARNECSVQQIQLTYNEQLCFSGLQCVLLQLLLKKGHLNLLEDFWEVQDCACRCTRAAQPWCHLLCWGSHQIQPQLCAMEN